METRAGPTKGEDYDQPELLHADCRVVRLPRLGDPRLRIGRDRNRHQVIGARTEWTDCAKAIDYPPPDTSAGTALKQSFQHGNHLVVALRRDPIPPSSACRRHRSPPTGHTPGKSEQLITT